jgi:flagellar motor switch protein FliN
VIEIDPSITREIINRLTGGKGPIHTQYHELTDLEACIMETPFTRIAGYMRDAWSNICDLRPILGEIETNPYYLQMSPPTEMTVLVTLEFKIGDTEGMINICYSYLSLEPIINKLNAQWWYSPKKEIKHKNLNLDNLKIDLQFELFNSLITFGKLKKIKLGDTIPFKLKDPENYCKIKSKTTCFFEGELIKSEKWKKVVITKKINKTEDNYMETKNNTLIGLNLNDVQIQLSVELGRTKRTIKEITSYGEGTIIELDKLAGEPVSVFANNVLIAKAEVVVIDENFGIRLVEIIDNENLNVG